VALDTREKRASVVSLYPGAPPSVTPDVTMDRGWRQESGWGYSGIFVGPLFPRRQRLGLGLIARNSTGF